MNLTPNIRIEFECAICGADCVDIMDRVAKRHPKDSICQVCEEQCEAEAEAAVIGLMVDSVTRPDPVAKHTFKTTVRYSNNGTEFTPYNRTNQPFEWGQTCWVHEYHPPTHRVSTCWTMLIIGLITIAAGFAVANWWVG